MEYQELDWEAEALYWKGKYIRELARQALIESHNPVSHQPDQVDPLWAHPQSGIKPRQYTEEEIDAMCDAMASEVEKERCREYNLREAEYYSKRALLDANQEGENK